MEIFKEVAKKQIQLEELRIMALANEVVYRQKGELHTAERFKELEDKLAKAVFLLEFKSVK